MSQPVSGTREKNDKFMLYSSLPLELRIIIFEFSLSRTIQVKLNATGGSLHVPGTTLQSSRLGLHQVSRDMRNEHLANRKGRYRQCFKNSFGSPILFDATSDILHFDNYYALLEFIQQERGQSSTHQPNPNEDLKFIAVNFDLFNCTNNTQENDYSNLRNAVQDAIDKFVTLEKVYIVTDTNHLNRNEYDVHQPQSVQTVLRQIYNTETERFIQGVVQWIELKLTNDSTMENERRDKFPTIEHIEMEDLAKICG